MCESQFVEKLCEISKKRRETEGAGKGNLERRGKTMHEARFELAQVSPSDLKADSLDRSDIRARFFLKSFFQSPTRVELVISRLEVERLIHWATGTADDSCALVYLYLFFCL